MSSSETGLPAGWEVRHSNSKNLPYYFQVATKDSRWEPPAGTDSEKLKVYMGQYHSGAPPKHASAAAAADQGKIRAAHLLIKHAGSRRPSSWRQAEISRTKDEARRVLEGHQQRIQAGEVTLGKLASTESDCSSARKNGDLGFFGRGEMQTEFEDAAFKLQPGQISDIIETNSGLHLIQRIE